MKVTFEFVLKNVLAEYLLKMDLDGKFIMSVFNRMARVDWGAIAFETDTERQARAFVEVDDVNASLIYWPSFERGLAITALQIVAAPKSRADATIAVYNEFKTDFDMIEGSGQWCLWAEDEILFTDSFKDVIYFWLYSDLFERRPQQAMQMLSKAGYSKGEKFAKQIAQTGQRAFNSIEDFVAAINQ